MDAFSACCALCATNLNQRAANCSSPLLRRVGHIRKCNPLFAQPFIRSRLQKNSHHIRASARQERSAGAKIPEIRGGPAQRQSAAIDPDAAKLDQGQPPVQNQEAATQPVTSHWPSLPRALHVALRFSAASGSARASHLCIRARAVFSLQSERDRTNPPQPIAVKRVCGGGLEGELLPEVSAMGGC